MSLSALSLPIREFIKHLHCFYVLATVIILVIFVKTLKYNGIDTKLIKYKIDNLKMSVSIYCFSIYFSYILNHLITFILIHFKYL